jgi:hypothetical protein
MGNKNLPKFVKYIFSSSKDWTGVWMLKYRDLYLLLASIGRGYIGNIVLADKICLSIAKSLHGIREDLQKCRQRRQNSGHSERNPVQNAESVDHQRIAENSGNKQLT